MFGVIGEDFIKVQAGADHAFTQHEKVAWSWGGNVYGYLGDNSRTNKTSPVSVSLFSDLEIFGSTGGYHAGAKLRQSGLIFMWGRDNYGQLGINASTSRSVPTSVSSADSWKEIACGWHHTVAIRGSDGKLYAWGRNTYGELGDNTRTDQDYPVSVYSADSFKAVAAGLYHCVAIRGDGRLFAWGRGNFGQLGNNTTGSVSIPTSVSTADSFKAVACGPNFAIAIKGSNGLLYSWGENNYGQLGDNSVASRSVPVSVSSADSFLAVACGTYHSIAKRGNGLLYAWGFNDYGQLGDNSTTDRSVPVSVSSADSWDKIISGTYHHLAIRGNDGLAYAWGYNVNGALGDNSTTNKSVPVSIFSSDSWKNIACGLYCTTGIKGSTGLLYAWGRNNYGQLGNNSLMATSIPTSVSSADSWDKVYGMYEFTQAIRGNDGLAYAWGDNAYGQLGTDSEFSRSIPNQISSSENWKDVCIGVTHVMAIRKSDGMAFGWGDNASGQLGDNNNTLIKSVPFSVANSSSWNTIAVGNYFALAINPSNGRIHAWGENTFGQLGNNSTDNSSIPIEIASSDSWVAVDCGQDFSAAIRSDGLLYTWGENTYGQLGDNSTTSRSVPISVSSADSWVKVTCGAHHILAIKGSNGLLYAWGANNYGQLGNNSITNASVPTSVSTADSWITVDAGYYHTVAIKGSNGLAYAWGSNAFGQLGDNSTTSRSVPTSVSSADSWVAIACSTMSSAIKGSNGLLYAWGENSWGQLGDNSTTSRSVPTSVSSADSWVAVDSGYQFAVALRGSDGKVYGWGDNGYGTLGNNSTTSLSVPTSIWSSDSWKYVKCGYYHTIAIKGSNGLLYSWGYNNYGQLGNPYFATSRNIPTQINSDISWKQLACGNALTVGIDGSNGLLYAWGDDGWGQLGINSTIDYNNPMSVSNADSFVKVATGAFHAIAIRGSDGRLYGWGYNGWGQLGDNSTTSKSVPISVSTADSFIDIACGYLHTLALRHDGVLFAWGYNGYGQLGLGDQSFISVPTSMSTTLRFTKMAAGMYFSCAIDKNKAVWAWGLNASTQTGNIIHITERLIAKSVSLPSSVIAIAALTSDVLVKYSDGLLYGWGYNNYGQLGIGSNLFKISPVSVSTTDSFSTIVGGVTNTLAIRGSDGLLYAWGENTYGQLGDNTRTSRLVPTSVSSADSFTKIANGTYNSCAIRGSDGYIFSWGRNTYGEFGLSFPSQSRSVPHSVFAPAVFVKVTAGLNHTVAIKSNGLLYGMGYNNYGALGDNTIIARSVPTSVSSSDSWNVVECGYYTTFAIKGSNGLLYAWGRNSYGGLGDNSRTNRSVPTSVSSADSWKYVACKGYWVTALRANDGRLYAWGYNANGQLGIGSVASKSVPTSVSSAESWVNFTVGVNHVVAIKGSNGLLYSWGSNEYGQLGNNSRTDASMPQSVSSADSFKAVAGGEQHTVAIRGSDGKLYAWGRNTYGQVGNNAVGTSYSVPQSVSSADSWVAVECGFQFSLAIRGSDGKIYAWGSNDYGQLGDNSQTSRSVPTSVSTADSFIAIKAGALHTVAVNSYNKLFTWGRDDWGQLGVNRTGSISVMAILSIPDVTTESWADVNCASTHTMAIRGSDGHAFGWGLNTSGELGDNNVVQSKSVPFSFTDNTSWKTICTQAYHCVAIRGSDGKLFAWGRNDTGQLGDNTILSKSMPTSVSSGDSFVKVVCSLYHNVAIRGSDGLLYAWGENTYGELGDNSVTSKSVPVSVSSADSWVTLACYLDHNVAIRGSDGLLYAWGRNHYGQLGNNSRTDASVPTSVSSADSWVKVACSELTTIAIRGSDGRLFSWGYGGYGNLGNNTTGSVSVPTSVSTADSFVDVVCANHAALAIRGSDGILYAWGRNAYGQVGDNSTTDRSFPVSVYSTDSWVAVACGYFHSAAIRGSDGKAYAWGDNSYGQLGDNSRTLRSFPVSVYSTDSWAEITGGYYHILAKKGSDGTGYGWGRNTYGVLGNFDFATSRQVPVEVNSIDSWKQLAGGESMTIGIRGSDGRLFSWGGNTYGQLGNNSRTAYINPVSVYSTDSFIKVACGSYHAVTIRGGDGAVFAWGYNAYGQVGDGSENSRSFPVQVIETPSESWKAVTYGTGFGAGIRKKDGLMYMWGDNTSGQLGDNSIESRSVPVSVSSTISWAKVACGNFHTIAINASDGRAYAWGDNSYGQLGDNYTDLSRSTPESVSSADSWKDINCGANFVMAIKGSNGLLYGWGANTYGQLGDNSTTPRIVPTSVSSADSWVAVACGDYYTAAIRGSDGLMYMWGSNSSGQLGINSMTSYSVPTSVSSADSWVAVACGNYHTVAIRGNDGRLFAWGRNSYGQLGDNSRTSYSVPTSVSSADSWVAVACGDYFTLAIRGGDYKAYGWGRNNFGQLGDNSIISKSVPTSVSNADSWVEIHAAGSSSLAFNSADQVWMWGDNAYGQLGNLTTDSYSVPTPVLKAMTDVIDVECGTNSSFALKANGEVFAWGRNDFGQMGDQTYLIFTPTILSKLPG